MNSLEDIWQSVLDKLGEKLTPTAMNTWFEDCRPVELGERQLVLQIPTDFKRSIIQQRFEADIKEALSDLFACDFDVLLLVGDEVEEYNSSKPVHDDLPEALDYTFDRFIVGSSNKFAHGAAVAVANNPGKKYNPLFIYGNSGLGKTHLLLAIGQAIREKEPSVKIAYVKGDDFTNEMVKSIRESTTEQFRDKYRHVDLFLVDDIQFLAGKEQTQVEFFHTFETLYQAQRQIVITSDRPPKELASMDDRLLTRFEQGLLADIQPPDTETRMAITRSKAQRLGLLLSDEVVTYIAEKITANIRQIEGVINKLTALNQIGGPITTATVDRAIADVTRSGIYIPTPEVIISETGRYFGIDEGDIRGQRRSKNTALARQVAMYLMRSLTNLSLVDIGQQFENRNHSTVLSSIRKVEDLIRTDPETASTVRDITSNINSIHDR